MESNWISVHDRLPEEDIPVLVYCDDDSIDLTRRIKKPIEYATTGSVETRNFNSFPIKWEVQWDYKCCCWEMYSTITHWMPLPDKPKD